MKTLSYVIIAALAAVLITVTVSSRAEDGTAETAVSETLCDYHGISTNLCTRCDSSLIPMFKKKGDWCVEHHIPESQCDLCGGNDHSVHAEGDGHDHGSKPLVVIENVSPDMVDLDWCADHRVPESECTKCNPQLVDKFKASGDWCGGHAIPESHCYLCNPTIKFPQEAAYEAAHPRKQSSFHPNTSLYRANAAQCATDQTVIQLASIQTPQRGGLEVESVQEAPVADVIDVPAEVEFDATAAAVVTSPVGGALVQWIVSAGSSVREGQILAYIESYEAAAQKAEYAHAAAMYALSEKSLERKRALRETGSVSAREYQEAEAEFHRAQADMQRAGSVLRMLRMSDAEMQAIAMNQDDDSRVPLRARQGGTLVEQAVSLGAMLEPGDVIGMVSQTERLWVEAQVRERDLSRLRIGQPVTISVDGNGWKAGRGHVAWIADGVDELTRMGRVRIEAEQNGAKLRAHQYVRAQIETTPAQNAVLVPSEAVQWEGCCNIVFVQETPDRFRPRKIKVEFLDHDSYAVSGLNAGEKIVCRGSYLLKTELMKSSLGAGCCGVGA